MMMMQRSSPQLWRKMGLKAFLFSTCSSTPSLSPPLVNKSLPILGPELPEVWIPNSSSPPPTNNRRSPFIFNHDAHEQTAVVIDGKLMADEIRSVIADEVSRMKSAIGKVPRLAVILVGERKDSQTYVRNKIKACQEVGIMSVMTELPEDCAESEVLNAVSSFNENPAVHGILVQLPLPQHMDEEKILNVVSLEKDVDGFHPLNIGNLAMTGREPLFIPCTPKACIELLLRSNVEIMGKKAVVIGRSNIVGLPTSLLLQRHHATVSVVHAFTKNPEEITREADIVVSAAGVANLVRGNWLKPGAIVIDVGTNPVKDPDSEYGYSLTGDVCYEEAVKVASAITPVPGGVGPMTIAMLLSNTLDSAKRAYRFT
ncbi:Tetrahydrofolate dehydrogenase/cyclohydrolase [Macleaya cordata]|uniref:Tetrahydrofolate dehydrogenase/cyclohydrolase n=1 Tax=Macleaya cordata TaxID=56857 RepID=A0A200R3A1_MACCD|nr:Tetrahydrofolate dehydrogenase/cyclohydrolase [Macleaya cordata]